jgi:hypothetical protein
MAQLLPDTDPFHKTDEFILICRPAVRKGQTESLRLGVANVCSFDGQLYCELPSGEYPQNRPASPESTVRNENLSRTSDLYQRYGKVDSSRPVDIVVARSRFAAGREETGAQKLWLSFLMRRQTRGSSCQRFVFLAAGQAVVKLDDGFEFGVEAGIADRA